MRSVVYRYDDLQLLADVLERARGQELPIPNGVSVREGEWVLAIFELGETKRATAAAGRAVLLDDGLALVFERRDWERLRQFANAPRGESATKLTRATPIAGAPASSPRPPAQLVAHAGAAGLGGTGEQQVGEEVARSGVHPAGVPAMLRSTMSWESADRASGEPPERSAVTTEEVAVPVSSAPETEEDPTLRQRRLSGTGSQVLLVDDDPDLREVVGAMLEAVGLQVGLVGSAEEALDAMARDLPDLVVLDWGLPGMNGLELCRAIRKDPLLSPLAVLFLTAHAGTQDMVEAFAAGADDYVVKPFRAAELGARIFGLLRRSRAGAPRGAH